LGKQYQTLTQHDKEFIKKQKLFFIASCSNHEVNLSPRGYESLYIHDEKTLYMIDYLGGGNRTARDISEDGELTLMFTAFEGKPKILRCFCKGQCIEKEQEEFKKISKFFQQDMKGIRHIFKFNIYALESSCGMGVPLMKYEQDRNEVIDYALDMAEKGKFDTYHNEHKVPPNLHNI
jgi:hypothetical protein